MSFSVRTAAKRKAETATVETKRTRSGAAFGRSKQLLGAAASPPRDGAAIKHLEAKTPSPRVPAKPERMEEDERTPASYGALYTHKSALDLVIEKEYVYFSGCGLTSELEAIRDRIVEGAYSDDPARVLADAEKLLRDGAQSPEKHPAAAVYAASTITTKTEQAADLCAGAVDKIRFGAWKPDTTAVDALAVVTDDGAPYILCADSQNVLWKRDLAGGDGAWTELSGIPTGPVALCALGTELFTIDEYNCVWTRDLRSDDASWVLLERSNPGKELTALAAMDGTLYAATKNDKLLTRKIDQPATRDGSGWAELCDRSGKPVNGFDIRSMAALRGHIYAANGSDELWVLKLGAKMSWREDGGALLPETYGLTVYHSGKSPTMLSANYDSVWQRPCGKDNEEKWDICSLLPADAVEPPVKEKRKIVKKPSRNLKCDVSQEGSKKPITGVYLSSEYRKPSKGFDLPHVGSAVLDLGAHVGWFTLWSLDNGASKVVSVEATPESYKYHKLNFKDDPRVTSVHAAVMSDQNAKKEKTVTFRIAPRGNNWRNCIDRCTYWDDKTTKNMGKVKVPTTSVERLLAEHPDVHMVKIDIEGAEMELLETVEWPQHVRYLVFEYSIGTRSCHAGCPGSMAKGCGPECAKVRFPFIREKLESQGFRVQIAPSVWRVVNGKQNAVYDEIIFCKRDVEC